MLAPDKQLMFRNRLTKMWKHVAKIAKRSAISCFRVYDHDLPEFPFAIEIYEDAVYIAEYQRKHGMDDTEHQIWLEECKILIAEVLAVPIAQLYVKTRKRKEDRTDQYTKHELEKVEKIVHENGLSFIINLTEYLDTGLFLDHRITREMVRQQAHAKHVLNLFCYTGSFSVYAAAGDAATVTSVDMSKTYIHWAKRNMQFNKLYQAEKHQFIQADVLEWIETIPASYYDIIVCDPPTFSNSKRMSGHFDVQAHHTHLLSKLLYALKPAGMLYFSNNYRNFELNTDSLTYTSLKDITGATTPFDFQGKLHRKCFLFVK